jgi:phenylalanyl-tRNA synthetase alpha subunit
MTATITGTPWELALGLAKFDGDTLPYAMHVARKDHDVFVVSKRKKVLLRFLKAEHDRDETATFIACKEADADEVWPHRVYRPALDDLKAEYKRQDKALARLRINPSHRGAFAEFLRTHDAIAQALTRAISDPAFAEAIEDQLGDYFDTDS